MGTYRRKPRPARLDARQPPPHESTGNIPRGRAPREAGTASLVRTMEFEDIQLFAALSGDINPAHPDPEYGKTK